MLVVVLSAKNLKSAKTHWLRTLGSSWVPKTIDKTDYLRTNIGALIIRMGFGANYTIIITRSPPKVSVIIKASTVHPLGRCLNRVPAADAFDKI